MYIVGPGSSTQKPIEHFHTYVLQSAQTQISQIKPPSHLSLLPSFLFLFSISGIPFSQGLTRTSLDHHSLLPLHYLSYLISMSLVHLVYSGPSFLPSPMAVALSWLVVMDMSLLFQILFTPNSNHTPHFCQMNLSKTLLSLWLFLTWELTVTV